MRRPLGGVALSLLVGAAVGSATPSEAAAAPRAPAGEHAARAASSLEGQFRDPPSSARPRVWWHWMNGNVTADGVAKDLAWMSRVGLGGVQAFDASVPTRQIVDQRLIYMTPEWKRVFGFAAAEADRLGLELGVASSPGWSATGGPWVKPEDGMKKLVWAETVVDSGHPFAGRLPVPPSITGPFQSLRRGLDIADLMSAAPVARTLPTHYEDVVVLAMPAGAVTPVAPRASLADGSALDAATLADDDLETGVKVKRSDRDAPSAVVFNYDQPQTIRSASVFVAGAKMAYTPAIVAPVLEASDDGAIWRHVADVPADETPTTVSFAPVTARYFRLVLKALPPAGLDLGSPAAGVVAPPAGGPGAAAPWKLQQFKLSSEPRIDRFETKAGFSLSDDYYAFGRPGDGAVGVDPRQVIDLTSRLKPDGALDWTPPPGRWRIIRIGYSLTGAINHPATPQATGLEVDKLDGEAVRRYLDHYLATYREAVGPGLTGSHGVRAIVQDSIEAGAANWTPRMIEQFKRLRGYDPLPWLPALTGVIVGDRTQSDAFLYDFRRTLADLMAGEHYGTVAKVAHENGLRVYSEALETGRPSLGDDMAMRSHADVPMAAMWTFSRQQGPNPSYVADVRGAASVAHVYGQNLVAAESMTSSLNYWADSPATLRRIIDVEFLNGVNLPVIHTSVHSPSDSKIPGLSLFFFGQFFNRHETWAEMAKPWVDYIARNSLMLQQGRNLADVAYFYGEEGPLTGLYGRGPAADAPKAHAYDFLNADALTNLLRNDGNDLVTPGGARYRVLYLGGSSRRMTLATLRRIDQLVENGATVVGLAPEGDPGLASDPQAYAALVAKLWPGAEVAEVGRGRVIASRDVEAALDRIGVKPQFRAEGASDAEVQFVQRHLPDGESFFVVNRKDRPEAFEGHFHVAGKAPELWHADTGESEPVSYRIVGGETIVPMTLAAEDSVHVVFRKRATASARTIRPTKLAPAKAIAGPWTVQFQAGRGAPASIVLPALAPLNESAESGVRYFSGVASYTRSFTPPRTWKPGRPLWLDLGEVRDVAEVRVNGQPVGTAWRAPYRIEIGRAARPGRNTLEVRVADPWVNRLIGDAQPGAKRVTFTSMPTYRSDAPLRRAGLIGPVQLLTPAR